MKKINISIPKPCTEDWDNMTQTEQGKHCASCNKVVIDFTKMTDSEMVKYLIAHKGKKLCGNFYHTQINITLSYIEPRKSTHWPAIAAMLIAGVFQLSNTAWGQKTQGQIKIYDASLANEKYPLGDKETEPESDSLTSYKIVVLDVGTKKVLPNTIIEIDSLGVFVTDAKGQVELQINLNKIPDTITIQFSSPSHETLRLTFTKNKLTLSQKLEVYLKEVDYERFMLKGDVSVDYQGN